VQLKLADENKLEQAGLVVVTAKSDGVVGSFITK